MTWKEFKEAVERLGVTDKTKIDWIDCGSMCDPEIFNGLDPKTAESIAITD